MESFTSPHSGNRHKERSPRWDIDVTFADIVDLDPHTEDVRVKPGKDTCQIPLQDEQHTTKMGMSLSKEDAESIGWTLKDNANMFAWMTVNMSGINPDIIVHNLATYK